MKYENILERLDFSEFEQLFQLKKHKPGSKSSKAKKKKCEETQSAQSHIYCLTANTSDAPVKKDPISVLKKERAQNLTIAKRRIGYTPAEVAKFIEHTDLVGLPGEQCELLLRGDLGIPTKEEVT